jgi:hypothetical protein
LRTESTRQTRSRNTIMAVRVVSRCAGEASRDVVELCTQSLSVKAAIPTISQRKWHQGPAESQQAEITSAIQQQANALCRPTDSFFESALPKMRRVPICNIDYTFLRGCEARRGKSRLRQSCASTRILCPRFFFQTDFFVARGLICLWDNRDVSFGRRVPSRSAG